MLRVCFHFLCLYFTNILIVSMSYLFIAFLLFVALPLWPTGILPSVLIFLCCSCLCNLCLSSVCSCHVFILYIVHTIYMSIFDRFLLFAALPLWPAVRQPSVLIFLYLIICIFSVCSFLQVYILPNVYFSVYYFFLCSGRLFYSPLFLFSYVFPCLCVLCVFILMHLYTSKCL